MSNTLSLENQKKLFEDASKNGGKGCFAMEFDDGGSGSFTQQGMPMHNSWHQ